MSRVSIYRVASTVARNMGIEYLGPQWGNIIEWAMEAESKIGSFDTYVKKTRLYASNPVQATGTIDFTVVPTHGDTITLNGVKITFVNTGGYDAATNAFEFTRATIESDVATQVTNLAALLNASTNNKINIATYAASDENTDVAGNDRLTITHDLAGAEGNDYGIIISNSATSSGKTLTDGRSRVYNKCAVLPKDLIKVLDVKRINATSLDYMDPSSAYFPEDSEKEHRYYVRGNQINFTRDIGDFGLHYLAFELDEDGYPMIKEGHEDAISAYIVWKLKHIDYINGKIPRYLWKDLQLEWDRLCAQARGKDNLPTPQEMEQMKRMWNTLIPIETRNSLKNF